MKKGWYLYKDGQQLGPYDWEALWAESKAGRLNSEDLVWHTALENWIRADQVSGLTAIPDFVKSAPPAPKSKVGLHSAAVKPPETKTDQTGSAKSNKAIFVAAAAALILFAVAGISIYYFLFADRGESVAVEEIISETETPVADEEDSVGPILLSGPGNTAGNIVNGGLAAAEGDWVYFHSNLGGSLHKSNILTGEVVALSADSAWFINVSDQWVFYSNRDDNNRVYRVKTDGSDRMALSLSSAWFLTLVDNDLYFINEDDNYRIYHLHPEDGTETRLGEDSAWFLNVIDGWIYYINRSDENTIYRLSADGSEKEQLNKVSSCCLNVVDNTLYYVNEESDSRLYRQDIDGANETLINEVPTWFVNSTDEKIYYADESDNFSIYSMMPDGSDKQKINNDPARYILLAGDWIYYLNHAEEDTVYKVKTDGSGKSRAEDLF